VQEYIKLLGSEEYEDTMTKSNEIWKEIKEKISPLFELLKAGTELCLMRLVGLLRNQLVREDNILHLVKNEGRSYKLINESMISVVSLLSMNLVSEVAVERRGAN
jgi:hypothetical protein